MAPYEYAPATGLSFPTLLATGTAWAIVLAAIILAMGGGAQAIEEATTDAAGTAAVMPPAFSSLPDAVFFAIAVIVLLSLSAFFSGSEVAFFSLHRLRLRTLADDDTYTGRLISRMMDDPSALLTTILAGNAVINVAIGAILGSRVDRIFHDLFAMEGAVLAAGMDTLAYVLAVVITTVVLVLFGEVIPKVIAVTAPEPFARIAAIPMNAADRLLKPLSKGCLLVTDFLFRVTRLEELRAAPFITDGELRRVLFDSEAQGVIHEQDMQMIQGILEISEASLRQVLTPRGDIVAIAADATVADALELLRAHHFSRLPVYEEDLDHVIGILVMKDLLPSFARSDLAQPVRSLMRKAHFVPETMSVNNFIKDAQRRRFHLSIVVDEYGGTAGLVTLEDAMEEIVGEIFDESDEEVKPFEALPDGAYRIEGDMPLDEFAELVGIPIEHDTHHTVAGYLMNLTERLLEQDEVVETGALRFRIEETDGRRIMRVRVEVLADPAAAEADAAKDRADD